AGARYGRDPVEAEVHALPLRAGQYIHLIVEQLGVDVVATVRDPAGHLILQVDGPSGAWGAEDLFLVARAAGRYDLTLRSWGNSGDAERSAIRLAAIRPATPEDRRRAAAAGAYSRARLLEGQ